MTIGGCLASYGQRWSLFCHLIRHSHRVSPLSVRHSLRLELRVRWFSCRNAVTSVACAAAILLARFEQGEGAARDRAWWLAPGLAPSSSAVHPPLPRGHQQACSHLYQQACAVTPSCVTRRPSSRPHKAREMHAPTRSLAQHACRAIAVQEHEAAKVIRPANDVLRSFLRVRAAVDPSGHDEAERKAGVGLCRGEVRDGRADLDSSPREHIHEPSHQELDGYVSAIWALEHSALASVFAALQIGETTPFTFLLSAIKL